MKRQQADGEGSLGKEGAGHRRLLTWANRSLGGKRGEFSVTRGPLEEMLSREAQKCPPESPRVSPWNPKQSFKGRSPPSPRIQSCQPHAHERVSEAGLSRTNRPGLGHSLSDDGVLPPPLQVCDCTGMFCFSLPSITLKHTHLNNTWQPICQRIKSLHSSRAYQLQGINKRSP